MFGRAELKVFLPVLNEAGLMVTRARDQQRQLIIVARLQRQVGDGVRLQYRPHIRRLGLQRRSRRR